MAPDPPAHAVFGLLSDATRVEILSTIARTPGERGPPGGTATLSFSEIYDRVDVEGTSKLSYHLGELEGVYLRNSPEGYSLTHGGEQIVRLLLSENYANTPDFDPIEIESPCAFCGAEPLRASKHNQFLGIDCPTCDRMAIAYEATPAQVRSRSSEELLESFRDRFVSHYRQVRDGLCPSCAGPLEGSVHPTAEMEDADTGDRDLLIVMDRCEECLRAYNAPLQLALGYHPASVSFHWERGVDVTSIPPWELFRRVYAGEWTADVAESGYEVVLRHDRDALRLDLDEDLAVSRTERVRGRTVDEERT
ncbi:hypothetical protein L593_02755 [Salinarchaeum sp. Harcht-Bsk1]|uniref:DUF7351 domain-containing protein n=1 Tax=Salinarchaeum sp. Harcht-Bsk1 TaxID=1333523 RepID=UPI00034244C7|nr:helix-turn-helix transcriptional regulator [Salinarchaeum sp. Harcht-Bsk1]AGN00502.1 hypothetical protein L593_02755 [Salinarchaeum sp. Harcht-Bsk1]